MTDAGASRTIFLVDDQPAVLKALARLLDSAGFHALTFNSAQQFLDSSHPDQPGCLILDLAMPVIDGIALQRALIARACLLPLIFLTAHGDMVYAVAAMKHGAFDFLAKPVDAARLIAAVEAALAQNGAARQNALRQQAAQRLIATLTPRERQVMALVAEGKLNKQTAAILGTTEKTIKVHRARVMQKTGADSVAALVRLWDSAAAKQIATNS